MTTITREQAQKIIDAALHLLAAPEKETGPCTK